MARLCHAAPVSSPPAVTSVPLFVRPVQGRACKRSRRVTRGTRAPACALACGSSGCTRWRVLSPRPSAGKRVPWQGGWQKYYGLCRPWAGAIRAPASGEGVELRLVAGTFWGLR